mmetsp:Transcript_51108/g.143915  ORF Transcript_51108/g.143915 Transcript_51108/m.143915 type:complete len:257 (-) Transcript_51108:70-840(-)
MLRMLLGMTSRLSVASSTENSSLTSTRLRTATSTCPRISSKRLAAICWRTSPRCSGMFWKAARSVWWRVYCARTELKSSFPSLRVQAARSASSSASCLEAIPSRVMPLPLAAAAGLASKPPWPRPRSVPGLAGADAAYMTLLEAELFVSKAYGPFSRVSDFTPLRLPERCLPAWVDQICPMRCASCCTFCRSLLKNPTQALEAVSLLGSLAGRGLSDWSRPSLLTSMKVPRQPSLTSESDHSAAITPATCPRRRKP